MSFDPLPFLDKTTGSNDSFTLIKNNFQIFKLEKFKLNVTVHYGLWAKCIQFSPHNKHRIEKNDCKVEFKHRIVKNI